MTEKRLIRSQLLAARDALPDQDRQRKSAAIGAAFAHLEEYVRARTVCFFVSYGSEVHTLPLIQAALNQDKRVVVPRVRAKEKRLELRQLRCPEAELAPGTKGIPEPGPECPEATPEQVELVVVPAVAWDEEGHRLGYGGGYYDRLLAQMPQAFRVGLGFEVQLVPKVPRGPHDLAVDCLVTEARVLRFSQGGELRP